jgi:hypothetical protein
MGVDVVDGAVVVTDAAVVTGIDACGEGFTAHISLHLSVFFALKSAEVKQPQAHQKFPASVQLACVPAAGEGAIDGAAVVTGVVVIGVCGQGYTPQSPAARLLISATFACCTLTVIMTMMPVNTANRTSGKNCIKPRSFLFLRTKGKVIEQIISIIFFTTTKSAHKSTY